MNSIGARTFTQHGILLRQRSHGLEWWMRREEQEIKLVHDTEPACGSLPEQQFRYCQKDMKTSCPNCRHP